MNTKVNPLVLAPCFPHFDVVGDITVQDGKVEFMLQYHYDFISEASIDCSMPVLECTQSFETGDVDPQNHREDDIPAVKAIENTLATVLKVDGVATKEGAEFTLLPDQLSKLNELLHEWSEDQFLKECEQQAGWSAEDAAEGDW